MPQHSRAGEDVIHFPQQLLEQRQWRVQVAETWQLQRVGQGRETCHGGRVLEAELDSRNGWRRATIRLDDRITNEDGELRFLD